MRGFVDVAEVVDDLADVAGRARELLEHGERPQDDEHSRRPRPARPRRAGATRARRTSERRDDQRHVADVGLHAERADEHGGRERPAVTTTAAHASARNAPNGSTVIDGFHGSAT